jgi:hypothetical protein
MSTFHALTFMRQILRKTRQLYYSLSVSLAPIVLLLPIITSFDQVHSTVVFVELVQTLHLTSNRRAGVARFCHLGTLSRRFNEEQDVPYGWLK